MKDLIKMICAFLGVGTASVLGLFTLVLALILATAGPVVIVIWVIYELFFK